MSRLPGARIHSEFYIRVWLFPDVGCFMRFCASVDIQYCHHLLNSSFPLALSIAPYPAFPCGETNLRLKGVRRELSQSLVIGEHECQGVQRSLFNLGIFYMLILR